MPKRSLTFHRAIAFAAFILAAASAFASNPRRPATE